MTDRERKLFDLTAEHFRGDAKRIQHFTKVYLYAAYIAEGEKLGSAEREILCAAAIVHDCGIVPAEEKFGRCDGKLQEQEGPAVAEILLRGAGYGEECISRACYLVAHHHTYGDIVGADYQILVEADFLVNFYEDDLPERNIRAAVKGLFRTETGIRLAATMYKAAQA